MSDVWWCCDWLADRTSITLAPRNTTVNVSTTVELDCRAETDDRELSSLSVQWFMDGLALSRNRDPRLRVDRHRGTLRLNDAQVCQRLRQLNAVNGGDNVFTLFCRSVCVCAAAWRHNSNDVITSPADCVLSVTSPAATLAARVANGKRYSYSYERKNFS